MQEQNQIDADGINWKQQTYKIKYAILKLEYETAKKKLVSFENVEKDWLEAGQMWKATIGTIPQNVAGQCAGKNANEIERILTEACDDVCRVMEKWLMNKA